MTRPHQPLTRLLAALLIMIQGLAGTLIVAAHERGPDGTVAVAEGSADKTSQHGDVLCPLCLLASAPSHQAPEPHPEGTAPAEPDAELTCDVVEHATTPRLAHASPRAPPFLSA